MSAAFRRNTSIPRLLQRHTTTGITDLIRAPISRTKTTPSRAYFRLSDVLRRAREYEISPSLFSSPFSKSFSKVGFVGWYLGMVKTRPVLTKSVTSGVIYTAADLSSQVVNGKTVG